MWRRTYTRDRFSLAVNCLWTHFKCHSTGVSSFHRRRFLSLSTQFRREIKEDCRNLFSSDYSRTILLFLVSLNHGNFKLCVLSKIIEANNPNQIDSQLRFLPRPRILSNIFDPMLRHHVCTSLVYHTISIIMSHIVFYAHFVLPSNF
jgi:hypothetical protein